MYVTGNRQPKTRTKGSFQPRPCPKTEQTIARKGVLSLWFVRANERVRIPFSVIFRHFFGHFSAVLASFRKAHFGHGCDRKHSTNKNQLNILNDELINNRKPNEPKAKNSFPGTFVRVPDTALTERSLSEAESENGKPKTSFPVSGIRSFGFRIRP